MNTVQPRACNCHQPANCPLDGDCQTPAMVYQAKVIAKNKTTETYVGLTENAFKKRYANHKASFKDPSKRLNTELSKHVWRLKDEGTEHRITWKILKRAAPFNPISNRCNLCVWEKYFIICKSELASLNKRNELVTPCRHRRKFLLSNTPTRGVT